MSEPLAQKVVKPAINTNNVMSCPSTDLIALVTIDGSAKVFRFSGQSVLKSGIDQRSARVSEIRWKPDGKVLALALDDHDVHLVNCTTGKISVRIHCTQFTASKICCLGWGVNFTDTKLLSLRLDSQRSDISLDEIVSRNPRLRSNSPSADLPLHLTFTNIEGSLPKLCPIVTGETNDDSFTSQGSVDSLVQPLTAESTDMVDILVTGFEDGSIHLSMYDTFEIGLFILPSASRTAGPAKPILHCSHPLTTTHAVITIDANQLLAIPFDLRLIYTAGRYLPLLASRATQLRYVQRYLGEVQKQLHSEFKISQELPKRFMGTIEQELSSTSDCSWTQSAYHLLVTGDCAPEVKEWLVDQLGDRGHKRWEKAITTGYEHVQQLIHENLLPALTRFNVLLSGLRGLSKYSPSHATLGLITRNLDGAMDAVNCLQLAAARILDTARKELHQFKAFSAWLQLQIERESNTSTPERVEKDSKIDYVGTLEYITGAMMHSRLDVLLNIDGSLDLDRGSNLAKKEVSSFELYPKIFLSHTKQDRSEQVPNLKSLLGNLKDSCDIVFNALTEAQRRSVRFGRPISLGSGEADCVDSKMVVEPSQRGEIELYVVVIPRQQTNIVLLYRVLIKTSNNISSTETIQYAALATSGWIVNDVKFVDDQDIMLAVSSAQTSRLLRLTYRSCDDCPQALHYSQVPACKSFTPCVDFSDLENTDQYTWLEFPPHDTSSLPQRLVINGNKGRRTVCVVGQDRFSYKVYDLDSDSDRERTGSGCAE